MKAFWKTAGLFCAVAAFLTLTAPSNHSEAEDTYYYAQMVERGGWSEMFHRHHLLYLPVARGIYRLAQRVGFEGRAMPVLIGLSIASASAVICFFSVMLRRSGAGRWWVVPLLFSYGFWRYACAAEIYAPALAAVCAAWFFSAQPERMWRCVCCSIFAVLLHLACLPAVLAIGVLFAVTKEWKRAGLFFLCTGLPVAAVYGVVQGAVGTIVFVDTGVVRSSLFAASTWVKALFAFGQNVLSGNFLFSIPSMAEWLSGLFPYQMLQEELFMGRQADAVWQVVSVVTFFSALLLLGFAVIGLIRNQRVWLCPMSVWFAGNMAMALWVEPANPEMYIFVLLPFWFLVANGWKQAGYFGTFALSALAAAMLLHNAIGGMAFVQREAGDYCRQKAAWVVEHATAEDVVLAADSHGFITYLAYWSPACTLDAKFQTSENIFQALERRSAGRVFVFSDVIEPLRPVARRNDEPVQRLKSLANQLGSRLMPVSTGEDWTIYEWVRQ
ncbi:MAG: hypothetical protein IT583_05845 [Verrucomicrobia bacterium]|nr:hypothetical protein [Verrucomicrobiota bacterium]